MVVNFTTAFSQHILKILTVQVFLKYRTYCVKYFPYGVSNITIINLQVYAWRHDTNRVPQTLCNNSLWAAMNGYSEERHFGWKVILNDHRYLGTSF